MGTTLAEAVTRHGVTVDDHHDLDQIIPVCSGLQRQGDIIIIPGARKGVDPVPDEGVAVVRGENGGNTHLLLADGDVLWTDRSTARDLLLGYLTVAEGATAYIAHPEHAYNGIGAGDYEIRRQREMADEIRMVQD